MILLGIGIICALTWGQPAALAELKDSPGLKLLEDIQSVITDLAEDAKPSVVSIFPIQATGRSRDVPSERLPNPTGSGSGVIVDPDGHIITNNHVVGEASEV